MTNENLKRFRSELASALDAAGIDHDRNIYKGGHEIAWRYHDVEVVDHVHVKWLEMISVVFWSDIDVERLLSLTRSAKRAVSVVLERRTQWEIETFCAKLEEIERQLTEGASVASAENPIQIGDPSARALRRERGSERNETSSSEEKQGDCVKFERPDHVEEGQRLYHRRSDLIGTVERVEGDRAWIKYELPWDPAADAEEVPIDELWRVPV